MKAQEMSGAEAKFLILQPCQTLEVLGVHMED
jgi:hypothetical protein